MTKAHSGGTDRPRYDSSTALDALATIDPGVARPLWLKIALAARAANIAYEDFAAWSALADNYGGERDCRAAWAKEPHAIGHGSLYFIARQHGWAPPAPSGDHGHAGNGLDALAIWAQCVPATLDHGYIARKGGLADGLRVYSPSAPPLSIARTDVRGWLAVPVRSITDDHLATLQFIAPAGRKLNLPGHAMRGCFVVGSLDDAGPTYLVEGIGQAWACWRASGHAAVCTFGAGRMDQVASELRSARVASTLIVVADRGKEHAAAAAARSVGGAWVGMPDDAAANYDANDYCAEHGAEALGGLLACPRQPTDAPARGDPRPAPDEQSPLVRKLDYVLAEQLPEMVDEAFDDELIEATIGRGMTAVLYGDSNSGKTFAAIGIAAAVVRGTQWLGRRSTKGVVLYLATEAPASVLLRVRAYQRHHQCRLNGFVVVRSPLNLFAGDADTTAVLTLVEQIEAIYSQKVVLLIGDTLARISAGANENSGEDMGVVIKHVDAIRRATGAAFLWIHHCGKDQARGMRGWSGTRAAIETEIEVSADDTTGLRVAEITKQRDIPGKGERVGFRLEPVHLGHNQWGTPRGSCIVVGTDAPPARRYTQRPSEIAGAIGEMLTQRGTGCLRGALAKHFEGRYVRTSVYREIAKMVDEGTLIEVAGVVALPGKPQTGAP